MRIPAPIVPVLAVVAAGCGGGGEAEPAGPPPSAAEARGAVQEYFAGISLVSGEMMCRRLSAPARERVVELTEAASCEAGGTMIAKGIPPELRPPVTELGISSARIEGRSASVDVTSDETYAERSRTSTLRLEVDGDRWVLADLPRTATPDPVTTCVVGGLEAKPDPFWRRAGRAQLAYFLNLVCKRAVDAGLLTLEDRDPDPAQQAALDRIESLVLRQMIRTGRVERP